jgi:hypothetical protein
MEKLKLRGASTFLQYLQSKQVLFGSLVDSTAVAQCTYNAFLTTTKVYLHKWNLKITCLDFDLPDKNWPVSSPFVPWYLEQINLAACSLIQKEVCSKIKFKIEKIWLKCGPFPFQSSG